MEKQTSLLKKLPKIQRSVAPGTLQEKDAATERMIGWKT